MWMADFPVDTAHWLSITLNSCRSRLASVIRHRYRRGETKRGEERIVLENVGHFRHREAADQVVDQVERRLLLAAK